MRRCSRSHACALAWLVLLALAAGCAGKPPEDEDDRKKTVLLTTEFQDRDAGSEAAEEVAAQLGLVDDPELVEYVNRVGARLVPHAPPRPFDYQFAIVDQFPPNAFALPGGYIYVSRGLLALAGSELLARGLRRRLMG